MEQFCLRPEVQFLAPLAGLVVGLIGCVIVDWIIHRKH